VFLLALNIDLFHCTSKDGSLLILDVACLDGFPQRGSTIYKEDGTAYQYG
jgi:hypothetical protein